MLLAVALLTYPAAVFFFLDSAGPVATAALFALVAGGRLLLAKNISTRAVFFGLAAVGLLCAITAFAQNLIAVKLYPVAISTTAALWCCYTLFTPPSAIERLLNAANRSRAGLPSRLREKIPLATHSSTTLAPSEVQRVYMRGLTGVWLGFFSLNAVLAAYTALAMNTGAWALYNGCISYLLVGVLLLLEVAYRGVYQRRHEDNHDSSAPSRKESHRGSA